MNKMDPAIPDYHVEGGFKWSKPPKCKCGQLAHAFEEKFFFVSNFVDGDDAMVYMMPVDSNGHFVRSTGVAIAYCPWCGDKIQVNKTNQ